MATVTWTLEHYNVDPNLTFFKFCFVGTSVTRLAITQPIFGISWEDFKDRLLNSFFFGKCNKKDRFSGEYAPLTYSTDPWWY